MLFYLESHYDIVCKLIFHFRHPGCHDVDPERYERAYRDKLHKYFRVYEPTVGQSVPRMFSQGTRFLLGSLSILLVLMAAKRLYRKLSMKGNLHLDDADF